MDKINEFTFKEGDPEYYNELLREELLDKFNILYDECISYCDNENVDKLLNLHYQLEKIGCTDHIQAVKNDITMSKKHWGVTDDDLSSAIEILELFISFNDMVEFCKLNDIGW